jgi:hypothetical protein
MNSSNITEIQSLFTILLDSVLVKVSKEHKIKLDVLKSSIGSITFTDSLNDSINNFCSSLNYLDVPKAKHVLKKTVTKEKVDDVEEKIEANTVSVEAPKPKKILKKTIPIVKALTENSEPVEAPNEPVEAPNQPVEAPNEPVEAPNEPVEAPKPKKVLKKTIPIVKALTENSDGVEVTTEHKPKKVLKKTISIVKALTENTAALEEPKPKKVLKKTITTLTENTESIVEVPKKILKKTMEPIVEKIITDIVIEEPEIKIKPKKIIVKRSAIEPSTIAEPQKMSKKEVDVVEYGLDERHDENAALYESIQMYEDDMLEPREINGVKYLIDSSEYIYDIESQELLGKLSEKDKNTILFLKNFTQ